MKKRVAVLLFAVLAIFMVACGADKKGGQDVQITDSLELLNTVWGGFAEEDKFPVGGGDSANINFEGPAQFDAANTDELEVTLGFPAAQADKIDGAASMMHMMNANNFTAGVYHLTDASNAQALADALKENILARQWICGMPEKMIVANVGDYVISVFGLNITVDSFKAELQEAYPTTEVLYEESIS